MAQDRPTNPKPSNIAHAIRREEMHNTATDDGTHPAAAPLGTDDEAGAMEPRGEPAKTYVVNSDGEVRAGPGDAGRQDAPRVLDDPQDTPQRGRGPLLVLLIAAPAVALLVWMLLA